MKKIILAIVSLVSVSTFAGLSVTQKKEIAKQQKYVDEASAQIKQACGCSPAVTIEWEKLQKVNENEFGIKGNGAGCFEGFSGVAAEICTASKAEFCKGVKKAVVTATNGSDYSSTFKAGTVTMVSASNGCAGTSDLQKAIEDGI